MPFRPLPVAHCSSGHWPSDSLLPAIGGVLQVQRLREARDSGMQALDLHDDFVRQLEADLEGMPGDAACYAQSSIIRRGPAPAHLLSTCTTISCVNWRLTWTGSMLWSSRGQTPRKTTFW